MTSIKASEFYRETERLIQGADAKSERLLTMVEFFQQLSQNVQVQRDEADKHGLPADAREQLEAYRRQLDEGPADGEGYAAPKEEAAPPKPRLPKGLMAKMREMAMIGPVAFEQIKHPDVVIEEAARKAGLATWTLPRQDGALRFFGLPEHAPVLNPAVHERNEEACAASDAVDLVSEIKALPDWEKMLPSEIAASLKVPQADVGAAFMKIRATA